jgi:hypothetical protein
MGFQQAKNIILSISRIITMLILSGCAKKNSTLEERLGENMDVSVNRFREKTEKKEEVLESQQKTQKPPAKFSKRAPIRRKGGYNGLKSSNFRVQAPFDTMAEYSAQGGGKYQVTLKDKDEVIKIIRNVEPLDINKKYFKQGETVGIIKRIKEKKSNSENRSNEVSHSKSAIADHVKQSNTLQQNDVRKDSSKTEFDETKTVEPSAGQVEQREPLAEVKDSNEET